MGTLVTSPPLILDDVVSTESLLPRESPLAMAAGDLHKTPLVRSPPLGSSTMRWRRAFILLSTAALTGAGGYEMYRVLQVGGVTVLEGMVLALFLLLLAWIAFSFTSALAGFFVLLGHHGSAEA